MAKAKRYSGPIRRGSLVLFTPRWPARKGMIDIGERVGIVAAIAGDCVSVRVPGTDLVINSLWREGGDASPIGGFWRPYVERSADGAVAEALSVG